MSSRRRRLLAVPVVVLALTGGAAAAAGSGGQILHVSYGSRPLLGGTLRSSTGQPLGGVAVAVTEQVEKLNAPPQSLPSITTAPDGSFAFRVPAGPSRIFTLSYQSPSGGTASQTVTVLVTGRVTIHVARTVPNGGTAHISGRVEGPDVPRGTVVLIEAQDGQSFRPFAIAFTDAASRWRYSYRFKAINARAFYHLRAALLAQPQLPYEPAVSNIAPIEELPPGR